jgi:hypothetical protein
MIDANQDEVLVGGQGMLIGVFTRKIYEIKSKDISFGKKL